MFMNNTQANPQPNNLQPARNPVKTLRSLAIFRFMAGIILTVLPFIFFFDALQQPSGFARNHAFFCVELFCIIAALPADILIMTIVGVWRTALREQYNIPKDRPSSISTTGLLLCCFFWLPVAVCLYLAGAF